MSTLPEPQRPRYRDVPRKNSNRTRVLQEAFFVPGPNALVYPGGESKFRCKAGPGMSAIPAKGNWYVVTSYLLRCMRNGDAQEGTQAQIDAHAGTVAPKTAAKKAAKVAPKTDKLTAGNSGEV